MIVFYNLWQFPLLLLLNNLQYYTYYKILLTGYNFPNLDEIKEELHTEGYMNLQKISTELFESDFQTNRDKFVFFYLDLEISLIIDLNGNFKQNFKIINVPIFNRILIENENLKLCILSEDDVVDEEMKMLLETEIPKIKSFIDDKPFETHMFKTSTFHTEGNIGGNLHCLLKNIY